MGLPLEIRIEKESDQVGIREVTESAFRGRPYAGGDEQDVIDRLRAAGALTLSLVALLENALVGQISFSPATASDDSGPWYALGPVSVLPSHQGKGIGAALIREGLSRLEKLGARGCILTGDPDYYCKFGFAVTPQLAPATEPAEYFMIKLLHGQEPEGSFRFHAAFYGPIDAGSPSPEEPPPKS